MRRWGGGGGGRRPPIARSRPVGFVSIMLDPRGAKAIEPELVDRGLPTHEFVHRQRVPGASFLKRQEAAADRSDDNSFASDDPAPGVRWREVRHRQGASIGANDVSGPRRHMVTHALARHFTCLRLIRFMLWKHLTPRTTWSDHDLSSSRYLGRPVTTTRHRAQSIFAGTSRNRRRARVGSSGSPGFRRSRSGAGNQPAPRFRRPRRSP